MLLHLQSVWVWFVEGARVSGFQCQIFLTSKLQEVRQGDVKKCTQPVVPWHCLISSSVVGDLCNYLSEVSKDYSHWCWTRFHHFYHNRNTRNDRFVRCGVFLVLLIFITHLKCCILFYKLNKLCGYWLGAQFIAIFWDTKDYYCRLGDLYAFK